MIDAPRTSVNGDPWLRGGNGAAAMELRRAILLRPATSPAQKSDRCVQCASEKVSSTLLGHQMVAWRVAPMVASASLSRTHSGV